MLEDVQPVFVGALGEVGAAKIDDLTVKMRRYSGDQDRMDETLHNFKLCLVKFK